MGTSGFRMVLQIKGGEIKLVLMISSLLIYAAYFYFTAYTEQFVTAVGIFLKF